MEKKVFWKRVMENVCSLVFSFSVFFVEQKVKWYRDTMILDTDGRRLMEERGSRHSLIIRKVQHSDFGNYSCEAYNKLGRSSKHVELSGKKRSMQTSFFSWHFLVSLRFPSNESLDFFPSSVFINSFNWRHQKGIFLLLFLKLVTNLSRHLFYRKTESSHFPQWSCWTDERLIQYYVDSGKLFSGGRVPPFLSEETCEWNSWSARALVGCCTSGVGKWELQLLWEKFSWQIDLHVIPNVSDSLEVVSHSQFGSWRNLRLVFLHANSTVY